jgi:hypothetical protein
MMTLIATIFSTAGKSSGQAQAQTRLQRQLRQASETIREDLTNTLPGLEASGAPKGVLAIAGDLVYTKDTPTAGPADHRVDTLMLITQQRFEPFIYQTPSTAGAPTIFEGYKQVVYGHADIGKLLPDLSGNWFPTVKRIENAALGPGLTGQPQSDMLASEWHLARRSIGFIRSLDPSATHYNTERWPLTSPQFLGTAATMADAARDYPLSDILSLTTPGYYRYWRDTASQQINLIESFFTNSDGAFRYDRYRSPFIFHLSNSPSNPYWYWWRIDYTDSTYSTWLRDDPTSPAPLIDPPSKWPPFYLSYDRNDTVTPGDLLAQAHYRFWPQWFCSSPDPTVKSADLYRTRLDPMPPPGMPERTSAYFLPACSAFKVEFTYDDPREIAVNSSNAVRPVGTDVNGDNVPDVPETSPVKWDTVPPGQIFVWTGLDVDPKVYADIGSVKDPRNLTFPYRWPRALRITIRAYAPGGALDYPIEQTLIHVW